MLGSSNKVPLIGTEAQRVKDVHVAECPESRFIQPKRIHYTQDGKQKVWDMCALHDSVSVLIYNRTQDALGKGPTTHP